MAFPRALPRLALTASMIALSFAGVAQGTKHKHDSKKSATTKTADSKAFSSTDFIKNVHHIIGLKKGERPDDGMTIWQGQKGNTVITITQDPKTHLIEKMLLENKVDNVSRTLLVEKAAENNTFFAMLLTDRKQKGDQGYNFGLTYKRPDLAVLLSVVDGSSRRLLDKPATVAAAQPRPSL